MQEGQRLVVHPTPKGGEQGDDVGDCAGKKGVGALDDSVERNEGQPCAHHGEHDHGKKAAHAIGMGECQVHGRWGPAEDQGRKGHQTQGEGRHAGGRDVAQLVPNHIDADPIACLLYTSPSPRDLSTSRMPSSA